MPLAHRNYANARVVPLAGRLDHDNCDGFRSDLAPHIDAAAADHGILVLDLSRLEYVSSAGLRCFLLAAKETGKGRLVVAAMQPLVAEIFRISRFDLVIDVFPTLRAALASVSAQAAEAFDRA